jgi:tetratricopeptide (TPR) repeat protein
MIGMLFWCCALVGSSSGDGETGPVRVATDVPVYEAARSAAGGDADAHVRLALWCEAHGMPAERERELEVAIKLDPSNACAQGLLGLVAHEGKWDRPADVGRQMRDDPWRQSIVKEYLGRRARTPDKAEAQMKLATWCEESGLKEEAIAHFSAVIRLDPSREAAWKRLGFKRHGSQWFKPEEAAAAKQEVAQQKSAERHWKPRLEKLRDGLWSKDGSRRARAEQAVIEVTDPRAVPLIWGIFVRGSERHQVAAVQMLGQIDGPSASSGLAVLAVFSPSGEVRRRAIETLSRRDPRDVVGRLIGVIRQPYKYQVRHVNGPGLPGELFVEGERFNILRFYQNQTVTPALDQGRIFTPDVPFDPYSFRNITMATMTGMSADAGGKEITVYGKPGYSVTVPFSLSTPLAAEAGRAIAANPQAAVAVMEQLAGVPANQSAHAGVGLAASASQPGISKNGGLTTGSMGTSVALPQGAAALGVLIPGESEAAQRDILIARQLEMIREANQDLEQRLAMDVHFLDVTNERINLYNDRALPVLRAITGQNLGVAPEKWKSWWTDQLGYVYQSEIPETKPTYTEMIAEASLFPAYVHAACFAAGTPVATIDGPRPIESIRVGDLVLSQGPSSGRLTFQPVLAAHRNPPSPTLCIKVGNAWSRRASTVSGKPVKDGPWPATSRLGIPYELWAASLRSMRSKMEKINPCSILTLRTIAIFS